MDAGVDFSTRLLDNFELVLGEAADENLGLRTELYARYAVLKAQLFLRFGQREDLEEAIEKGRHAVEKTGQEDEAYAPRLSNLGIMLQSRYEHTGKLEDLDEVIHIIRQWVKITPDDDLHLTGWLNNLGVKLENRYERTGMSEDLDEAIRVTQQAVKITPEDHPNFTVMLNNLIQQLERRYERTGKMEDLEEAIRVAQQVVDVIPGDNPNLIAWLNNVGVKLESRYERTGKIEELDEAIRVTRKAIKITPEGYPNLTIMLNNLIQQLERRYERTGKIDDLEEAIQASRRAVKIAPKDHPNLAVYLTSLGNQLRSQYKRTGKIEDLDEVIQVIRQGVKITPDDDPNLVAWLYNLVQQLERRYERTGKIDDLEEAIQASRRAVQIAPKDHPNLVIYLMSLGNQLRSQYERTGKMEDLDEAIRVTRQIAEVMLKDDPNLVICLKNMGNQLESRYERSGKITDLEEAIQVARQAVEITSKDHANLVTCLHSLVNRLESQYKHTRKAEDLEDAIQITRQAVKVTPEDDSDLAALLNIQGQQLERRYERTGKIKDLEEAIQWTRQAVEVTPKDHPDFATWLNNLGQQLERRYERTGKMEDLEEAIQGTRQAVEVTPKDHPDFAAWLNNLGRQLERRYERTRMMEDLEEAIQVSLQSVEITPKDHPNLTFWLNNLGNQLVRRYKRIGKMEDLDEAIQVTRKAVEITPKDHPNLATCLYSLGNKLMLPNPSNPEACRVLLEAWNSQTAIPFIRVRAATIVLQLLRDQGDYKKAYKLSVDVIDILPRVHNRSLSHQDQQYVISLFSGLATNACSLALQIGEPPERALEMLEQGRGVILSLLIDDRNDTPELKTACPHLYALYKSLRLEVNTPIDGRDQRLYKVALNRRPKAIEELEECIREIQQHPETSHFQKGLTAKQMQECSADGCIVIVNITDLRSDAIIVSPKGFGVIPLLDLDASCTKTWIDQDLTTTSSNDRGGKNKAYLQFLSWLWRGCVKPVLDDLRYYAQSSVEDLPRIWWVGTGLASSFPFHAAGDRSTGLTESAYSRVISSYTPTIKALQYARERARTAVPSRCDPWKVLTVTMPETPGASNLPGTIVETSEVIAAIGPSVSIETLEYPDVASAMIRLQECNVAHFACHGISDPSDPSRSGLILQTAGTATEEPRQDILSVGEVFQAHLSRAEIAYLSACSTAQNKAAQLLDEVLHVASGFQVAGFRHVVGCLWPSDDEVCVAIAKSFYYDLSQGGAARFGDDKAVALALHRAAMNIRENREYRKRPLLWAQYVHFGA